MVVAEHMLISTKVEFVVILGMLSETDGGVLVNNTSDLHDRSWFEFFWVTLELDYFDLGVVWCFHEEGALFNTVNSSHEGDGLANEHWDLVLGDEGVWFSVDGFDVFSWWNSGHDDIQINNYNN